MVKLRNKKQSRQAWRKRGAALEEAALDRRRAEDQERRTGGSMAGLSDAALFAIEPLAGGAAFTGVERERGPLAAAARLCKLSSIKAFTFLDYLDERGGMINPA